MNEQPNRIGSRRGLNGHANGNGNGHGNTHTNGNGNPNAGRPLEVFDYMIVGAGFAGSVLAERLARGSGKHVLLVDRRAHVGGNPYEHYAHAGMLVHKGGPHISHTTTKKVFDYLSRFTEWGQYQHKVLAS